MHEGPDERTGFGRADPKTNQGGEQIKNLQVYEELEDTGDGADPVSF